ncbi:Uncharacterised protein [Bordetella pertussis]|nr:Uncharacterised protein [Bordetella pertussis]
MQTIASSTVARHASNDTACSGQWMIARGASTSEAATMLPVALVSASTWPR